jgi:hypothetical protein
LRVSSFALLQKKQKSKSKNAFTHYFMLFADTPRRREGDFQQAEKQHKIVATANFDTIKSQNSAKCNFYLFKNHKKITTNQEHYKSISFL